MSKRNKGVIGGGGGGDDDSDLADLIQNQERIDPVTAPVPSSSSAGRAVAPTAASASSSGAAGNNATKAMNLDHVTQGKQDFDTTSSAKSRGSRFNNYYHDYGYDNKAYGGGGGGNVFASLLDYLAAYISLTCYYYPNICSGLAIFAVLLIIVFLANLVLNPVEEFGVFHQDFSDFNPVRSKYSEVVKKIDHWCLEGGDTNCDCEDPLIPTSRMEHRSWVEAFQHNRHQVQKYTTKPATGTGPSPSRKVPPEPDVAFLGSSIVEEMDGRWMGVQREGNLRTLEIMFKNHFQKKPNGATIEGVALGVAGDTAPNVLFRILHGEMPDDFNPKIWWITLGMNELGRMKCSEEVVVLGILRVVEEIMERKPNARIVINSLFPMVSMRGEAYPLVTDYKDSFNEVPKKAQMMGMKSEEAPAAGDEGEENNRRRRGGGRRLSVSRRLGGDRDVNQLNPLQLRPGLSGPRGGGGGGGGPRGEKFGAGREPVQPLTPHERSEELERIRAVIADRHKRMGLFHRAPKDPINPKLVPNQNKIRKFVPGTLKKRKIPLWTSIRAINKQLEKFADKNPKRVSFFDATPLFSQKREDGSLSLSSTLITIRGHPTPKGYSLYEDAIVKKVTKIITKMKIEQPELFPDENAQQGSLYNEAHQDIFDEFDTDDQDMFYNDDDMFGPGEGGTDFAMDDGLSDAAGGEGDGDGDDFGGGGGGDTKSDSKSGTAGGQGKAADDAKTEDEATTEDSPAETVEKEEEVSVARTETTSAPTGPVESEGSDAVEKKEKEEDATHGDEKDEEDADDGDKEDEEDADDEDDEDDEEDDDDDDDDENADEEDDEDDEDEDDEDEDDEEEDANDEEVSKDKKKKKKKDDDDDKA